MNTKLKIIGGHEFPLSQPYAEGHVLTAAEAYALNQARSEGVASGVRKIVQEKGPAAAEEVAAYDAAFTFDQRRRRGRTLIDPVEREARTIARDAIRQKLAETGRKLKDIDPATLNATVDKLVEENESIRELAQQRIDARTSAAKDLESLSL